MNLDDRLRSAMRQTAGRLADGAPSPEDLLTARTSTAVDESPGDGPSPWARGAAALVAALVALIGIFAFVSLRADDPGTELATKPSINDEIGDPAGGEPDSLSADPATSPSDPASEIVLSFTVTGPCLDGDTLLCPSWVVDRDGNVEASLPDRPDEVIAQGRVDQAVVDAVIDGSNVDKNELQADLRMAEPCRPTTGAQHVYLWIGTLDVRLDSCRHRMDERHPLMSAVLTLAGEARGATFPSRELQVVTAPSPAVPAPSVGPTPSGFPQPAPTPSTGPPSTARTHLISEGTVLCVVDVPEDDTLNIRSGPSSSSSIVGELRPGSCAVRSDDTDRSGWIRVQAAVSAGELVLTEGWVFGPFVRPAIEVDSPEAAAMASGPFTPAIPFPPALPVGDRLLLADPCQVSAEGRAQCGVSSWIWQTADNVCNGSGVGRYSQTQAGKVDLERQNNEWVVLDQLVAVFDC